MMLNRIVMTKKILSEDGVFFHHIDENEHQNASVLLTDIFTEGNRIVDVVWKNSSKNGENYVSMQHEYIIGAVKNIAVNKGNWKERKEGLDEIYKAFDGFRKNHGTDWKAIHRDALDFYNSFPDSNLIKDSSHYSWMDERGVYFPDNISKPANGYFYDVIHPITQKPCKKPAGGWRFIEKTMLEKIKNNEIHFGDDHTTVPNNKTYLKNTEEQSLTSIKYKDGRIASNLLKNMFGEKDPFKNPKDVDLSIRILKALETIGNNILDFFGGSGTTGHAVINLNREDDGKRKYILVEMGAHFDTVTKPRIQKVIYSKDWKDGKPVSREGISQCFKYLRLESYEDTLNNLNLVRSQAHDDLFAQAPEIKEDYLLHYMLDIESKGSLLSVNAFQKPFDYTLKIATDSAGAYQRKKIDLVETFNYLLGLRVKHIDQQRKQGFVTVTGTLPTGETCLVIWRDMSKIDYEGISRLCVRLAINPADNEFDVVYINGDHNIPTVLTQTSEEGGATRVLKLRQIEHEFLARMFTVEDV